MTPSLLNPCFNKQKRRPWSPARPRSGRIFDVYGLAYLHSRMQYVQELVVNKVEVCLAERDNQRCVLSLYLLLLLHFQYLLRV